MKGSPLLPLLMRLLLAGVLVYAAIPKIMDPAAFANSVRHYRLLAEPVVAWIALFLPWLELVLAAGILVPSLRRASTLMLAGLLLLFIAIHISGWARGINPHCGCFGNSDDASSYQWLLLRNSGLLLATAILLADAFRRRPEKDAQ